MKIVIAPDSFKGSLSALDAAMAIKNGLYKCWPKAEYCLFPVADGGEGTVETLVTLKGGRLIPATVNNPLGRPINIFWGLLADGQTAVLETAASSGLTTLTPEQRDPSRTSTFGLGQTINEVLAQQNVTRLLVGLGGSS
ncbi:MAG: glycerate kinase, partial [Candidatus Adiutrix sp.]